MSKTSFAAKTVAFVLAALLCAACLLTLVACKKKGGDEASVGGGADNNVTEREVGGQKYTFNNDLELFVLVAVDEGVYTVDGYELGGGRANAIFIAAVDKNAHTINLIQLDQNTLAPMKTFNRWGLSEGNVTAQLSLAYAYGDGGSESGQNVLNAVKALTGLPKLTGYVAIKSSAMADLARLSGAVTMTLTEAHTDYNAAYTKGSTVTLQTSEFEDFLRDQGFGIQANRKRMARMRDFVPAFFAALAIKKDQAGDQVTALESKLQYNITAEDLATKLNAFATYTLNPVVTPEGQSQIVGDAVEFTVNADSLNQILTNACYKKEG